jgi:hypothetical protein
VAARLALHRPAELDQGADQALARQLRELAHAITWLGAAEPNRLRSTIA